MEIKKSLLGCALAATFITTSANAFIGNLTKDFFFNPYVGAEVAARNMDWESGFGDKHFKENFTNTNLFFGAQFHRNLAIEAGFQTTNTRDNQAYYLGVNGAGIQDPVLGYLPDPVLGNEVSSIHFSQAKVDGWHLNLVGLLPVLPTTTLFASIGAAWTKFHVSTVPIYDAAGAVFPDTIQHVSSWESSRKARLRLGVGVKQMITQHLGTRLSFNWEKTKGLTGSVPFTYPTGDTGVYTAKSKNSYLIGLGFFYQLCPDKNI